MSKKKNQSAAKGQAKLSKALTMVKASVKEARTGLIPSEETDAQLPLPGPLELLEREGLSDHCEMCGSSRQREKFAAGLEPAFDPDGTPKTLCRECRIGSAELRESRRLKFTSRQTDTIIAALRLWQRSLAYPEIDLAEEHGKMLSDKEIDALIETTINR